MLLGGSNCNCWYHKRLLEEDEDMKTEREAAGGGRVQDPLRREQGCQRRPGTAPAGQRRGQLQLERGMWRMHFTMFAPDILFFSARNIQRDEVIPQSEAARCPEPGEACARHARPQCAHARG